MPCSDCAYWDTTDQANGKCRRVPPALVYMADAGMSATLFPQTTADDWCGEWATSEPAKPLA